MYKDLPDDLVFEMMSEIMFKDIPLSFPILGTESTINNINRNEIKEYYNNRYTAENIVISIAGNVDVENIIHQLNSRFNKFNNNKSNKSEIKFNENKISENNLNLIIKGEFKKPNN
jgi:Predicted Zn-dependent peptidases